MQGTLLVGFRIHRPRLCPVDPSLDRELLVFVYDELRSLARSRLAHNPGRNTLQPTALVHEAYLRITKRGETRWNGKGHFFAAAAEAMRQILVEQARSKSRLKRGGDRIREQLGAQPEFDAPTSPEDLLVIDEAVSELSRTDESLALIVKLRFFSGLSPDEIATLMGVSRRTVERRWRFAAALLRQRLEDPDSIGTNNAGSNRHLLENETSPWESESA
jgi:RNA polymerase sigma factor (TIGR02999 family)